MKTIVKIQRPLMTTVPAGEPDCLIYNEDRSIERMVPSSEVALYFKDYEYKVYMNADYDGVKLTVWDFVDEQEW